ncbi:MAG: hypothetical protein JXQ71_05675 [Verrucomicrobia bacterium]|nr:hypothetical protein [Verrucomicrobiota bacterium]
MSEAVCERWYCLRSGKGGSAFNMALDEALLEHGAALGRPVLRLYGWTEPAATFGYFQRYADVEVMTTLRPLVRRPTAGGLVPHDADWTYSLVIPPAHRWYALRAVESYRRLHQWLRRAFAELGVPTTLAPARRKDRPGQCFAGAEQSDLLIQNRKIAGAAQRRNRQGLLIQGSVQPPPGLPRGRWEDALCAVAVREWGVAWTRWDAPPEVRERAEVLVRQRYGCAAYNRRRSTGAPD